MFCVSVLMSSHQAAKVAFTIIVWINQHDFNKNTQIRIHRILAIYDHLKALYEFVNDIDTHVRLTTERFEVRIFPSLSVFVQRMKMLVCIIMNNGSVLFVAVKATLLAYYLHIVCFIMAICCEFLKIECMHNISTKRKIYDKVEPQKCVFYSQIST